MSDIDNAIARLQDLSQQISGVTIKAAPDYPVEDATVLPMSIAHLRDGSGAGGEATFYPFVHNIGVDFHVSRISLRTAYTQVDSIVPEYIALIAGDPTLNGMVDTVQLNNVSYTVQPAQWDTITTLCVFFTIPVKIIVTPSTSS